MKHYTPITPRERMRIEIFLGMEIPIDEIAQRLRRHRSTIYRELKRNRSNNETYKGNIADKKAYLRRNRGVISIKNNVYLQNYIKKGLAKGWSPEQISGRMKLTHFPFYV